MQHTCIVYCVVYLLIRLNWNLVSGTAMHSVMVVRILPGTHPVAGEAGLHMRKVGQLTLVVSSGIVDIELEGAFQLQFSWREGEEEGGRREGGKQGIKKEGRKGWRRDRGEGVRVDRYSPDCTVRVHTICNEVDMQLS